MHFGLPYSLVDCQQISRAGRNGELGCHDVLYRYTQKGKNVTSHDIKEYASSVSEVICLHHLMKIQKLLLH